MECLYCRGKIGTNVLSTGVFICAQEHILCNVCACRNRQRCIICGDAQLTEYILNSKPASNKSSKQTLISLRHTPAKTRFWDDIPTENSSIKLQDSENTSEIKMIMPHSQTGKYWQREKMERDNTHDESLQRITDDVLRQLNEKESKFIEELVKKNVEKYMKEILATKMVNKSEKTVQTGEQPVIEKIKQTDYTVLTSTELPNPVCAEIPKPKSFGLDQKMQAVYEAIKECSTPLNETEFLSFEHKWRDMHIPTAPVLETDSSWLEQYQQGAKNQECTSKHSKKLIPVSSYSMSDKNETQQECNSLENIKHLKKSVANIDLINAQKSSTETELESSDCASEIFENELNFVKSKNQAILKEIINNILQRSKRTAEVGKSLARNHRTILLKLRAFHNESLKSVHKKRYASSIQSDTDISEATDKESVHKSSSIDTFVINEELLKWKTIEHPNVFRVFSNPIRLKICSLHGLMPCHCDFKMLGTAPMTQAITEVQDNQNYKLKESKLIYFEELTMLHSPLECSIKNCDATVFMSDISRHLRFCHTELPLHDICNGERIDFELEVQNQDYLAKTQQLFMVSGKIWEMGSSQFKNILPMMLMTAKIKLSTLANWQQSEPPKHDEDYLLVWICGFTTCEFRPTYTFTAWRYKQNVPLCHVSNTTHIICMRQSLKPIDIYHMGNALLLSPNELNLLSDRFQQKMQCQLVVH